MGRAWKSRVISLKQQIADAIALLNGIGFDIGNYHISVWGALRILIVDDDAGVTGFLKELLADDEFNTVVDTARDGFEAGLKVHSFLPDVVLLDLMMPGSKGP